MSTPHPSPITFLCSPTLSGDVSLSAEDKPPDSMLHKHANTNATNLSASGSHQPSSSIQNDRDNGAIEYLDDEDEEDHQSFLERHTSIRFLLAGGIAGAGTYLVKIPHCPGIKIFNQFHEHARHRSIV